MNKVTLDFHGESTEFYSLDDLLDHINARVEKLKMPSSMDAKSASSRIMELDELLGFLDEE